MKTGRMRFPSLLVLKKVASRSAMVEDCTQEIQNPGESGSLAPNS